MSRGLLYSSWTITFSILIDIPNAYQISGIWTNEFNRGLIYGCSMIDRTISSRIKLSNTVSSTIKFDGLTVCLSFI